MARRDESRHRPHAATAPRDAAAKRAVFGQNLKLLAVRSPSISQLCRDIGINRTQFNRYLSGEAFPRPDVLDRICRHFGTDARILLEPLDPRLSVELSVGKALSVPMSILTAQGAFWVDEKAVPDGHYLMYRRASYDGATMICYLLRFERASDGVLRIFGHVPPTLAQHLGLDRPVARRRLFGFVMQQPSALTFFLTVHDKPISLYGSLGVGYLGNPQILQGVAISTHEAGYVGPVLLERVEGEALRLRNLRRRLGALPRDAHRPHIRSFFERRRVRD